MLRLPFRSALVALGLLAVGVPAPGAAAQDSLDVTIRFLPDLTPPAVSTVRAFVPGSFNDWGPNSSGQIQTGAPSQASYRGDLNEYRYAIRLEVGETYAYKIHYHENSAGTAYTWLTDPLNDVTTGPNNDSVLEVADPMLFQPAREQNNAGQVTAVSAGLFASAPIASIAYTVNDTDYADGLDHYDAASGIFRRTLPTPVAPGAFTITATTSEGETVSAVDGIAAPDVVDQARPAGLKDGITLGADGTSATFSLYAPGKQFVYLLGDFNGWAVEQSSSLFRDQAADGTWWWAEVSGLTPGEYYAFQYLVDGQLRIADPYSPLVLDPGGDGFIPDAVWPNLPDYPDEARGVAGLFRAGGLEPFTFSDFDRPDMEDLVVYEMIVRDFLSDHSFETLTDTLDYLDRLGVNAIELMPVSEFDGNESWGYNPSFHLALDKYYGTPLAFKQFVEAAHQRGIAVILDVVYNHATGQSPLIQLYNEGEFGAPTADNPYANTSATHPFNVFNDLNHESAATQRWLDEANRWWLEEYNVDGFRYDLSKGFMQTGPWDGFNQSRIDLLTRMMDEVWTVDPDAYVILEHLNPNQQEERELAAYRQDEGRPGAALWNKMNREYNQASMGYPTATDFNVDLRATYAPNAGYPLSGRVAYMESHDEQWLMWRNLAFGNSAGDYDVTELPVALERQKLAGAFFFPVPGPRMLWQFGELGYGGGPGECLVDGDYPGECETGVPGRVSAKPIRWDYWQPGVTPDPGEFGGALPPASANERLLRQRLYKTWAALINLRMDYQIFQSESTEVEMRVGRVPDRFVRLTLDGAPDGEPTEAIIFGNHGVTETTIELTFDEAGTWYDFFADGEVSLQAGTQAFVLQPGEFRVWTDVDVPSPEMGLIGLSSDDDFDADVPDHFGISAAFPNPAATSATLRYGLTQAADVRVEVVDVLGRQVYAASEGPRAAGLHTTAIDASRLPAGLYLVRLTAGDRSDVVRITVAR